MRTFNLDTSAEHDWSKDGTGEEADRNKMQTTAADKTHVAKAGDTLKKLAMRYYGDPSRSTEIYDANKVVLTSSAPDDPIKAGTSLTIPKAVEGGYFIDHRAADPRATPRTAKTDAQVPQDYVWPGEEPGCRDQTELRGAPGPIPCPARSPWPAPASTTRHARSASR